MSTNDVFEEIAQAFLEETGMLAPGKDQPAAMGGSPTLEERGKAYSAWLAKDNHKWGKKLRLGYAIDLTLENMAMLGVPFAVRDSQIELLKKQMAEAQECEPYPNSQVELYWSERESKNVMWNKVDDALGTPVLPKVYTLGITITDKDVKSMCDPNIPLGG
jgi:hypothetical protein